MHEYNLDNLNINNGRSTLLRVFVAEENENKHGCDVCSKKAKFLFSDISKVKKCSKCIRHEKYKSSQLDKIYNFVYQQNHQSISLQPTQKTNQNGEGLNTLYRKAFVEDDPKSMADFLKKFEPLMFKHAKYTSRENDFDDIVQFFREKIIYYHRRERDKGVKYDYTDPKHLGVLVKTTAECVLNAVNLLISRKESICRKGDFEPYTEIADCYHVQTNFCVENYTHNMITTESLKKKFFNKINSLKKSDMNILISLQQDIRDIEMFVEFMVKKGELFDLSLLDEKRELLAKKAEIELQIQHHNDLIQLFELLVVGAGFDGKKLQVDEIKELTSLPKEKIVSAFKELKEIFQDDHFRNEKEALLEV